MNPNQTNQINFGNGASIDASTKWSPYNPFSLKEEKDVLTLSAPKFSNFGTWYNERILGYSGLTMEKYLKQDAELLKDTLENLLITKDQLTLLNWLSKITRLIGDTSKEFVTGMPEDFIKGFSLHEDQIHMDLVADGYLWAAAMVDISPVHVNYHLTEPLSKEAYQFYPIYSLKLLALWILKILEMVHNKYETEEEFECTFNEVCDVYITYQNNYWYHVKDSIDVANNVDLSCCLLSSQGFGFEFTKFISSGHRCKIQAKYVYLNNLVDALTSIYNNDYKEDSNEQEE